MKFPNANPNTNAHNNPTTLRNSLIQSWLRNADSPAFPIIMTNTPPESEADQREKLLMILDAAIALADDDTFDFDFDPNEPPQSPPGALG
jgi:hypothetical protein